jgi:hypothetical protein
MLTEDRQLMKLNLGTYVKPHMVMKELHEGPSSGHFATGITQRKILDVRY